MAKGKKNVLRTDINPEETAEHKVTSRKETKENKPSTNKDCVGKVPSIFQSLRSPSKPRSPLSDSSSMLIQEGNESDAANPDMSKPKKDIPNEMKSESCESKEHKPEMPCHSHGIREPLIDQPDQKESTTHTNTRSAADSKAPASKPRRRTGHKLRAKKLENKAPQNRKVTDYYPIRRSNRKTKAELKNEEHRHIDDLIKNGIEEGMQVKNIEGKGRGVFAVKGFTKGEFVVEYHGDLLELPEAKKREAQYAQDPQTGCYMYYFQYQSKTYCVDATKETSRLGRLINHSKTGNCQTKLHAIDGAPHLILVASREIKAEEELLYDYGDRSKDSVLAHPWLNCTEALDNVLPSAQMMMDKAVVAGIQQAHAEQLANMRIQDLNVSLKPLNSVNNPILRKRKLLGPKPSDGFFIHDPENGGEDSNVALGKLRDVIAQCILPQAGENEDEKLNEVMYEAWRFNRDCKLLREGLQGLSWDGRAFSDKVDRLKLAEIVKQAIEEKTNLQESH